MESNLIKANRLYKEKKFEEALSLYLLIKKSESCLSRIIDINIKKTRDALGKISILKKEEHINLSTEDQNRKFIPYSHLTEEFLYSSTTGKIENFRNSQVKNINNSKVSIVVPAHNAEQCIVETLNSLLAQSHKNIEIIVIDDASEDSTPEIVRKIAKKDKRIKYHRMAKNMGTYFARSFGIHLASGEYVTFNDADDYSHHLRIELHLAEAQAGDFDVTTSNYIRYNPFTGEALETHGKVEHYGFITTFAKKEVFSKIGSFDLTTRGGDAEFSLRLKKFYDKKKIKHLPCPTYLAAQMPGSLTFSEINPQILVKQNSLSYSRKRYAAHFNVQQRFFGTAENCARIFAFPMLRSPYRQPALMRASILDEHLVYGCMCTIPSRRNVLIKAFRSIICQVDKLFIYPDKYEEELPHEVKNHEKVVVLSTKEYPNLGAGGKFLPLFSGMADDVIDKVLYFTFDDDIEYPKEYVHTLAKSLKEREFHCVVGIHGTILNENFENYKKDRTIFHFKKSLTTTRHVDVIGTGTAAFKASLLRDKFHSKDVYPYMIDIALARVCRRNSLPVICLEREAGWLVDLSREVEDDTSSIWNTLVNDNAISHTTALAEYGKAAWGDKAIEVLVKNRCLQLPEQVQGHAQSSLEWSSVPAIFHAQFPTNGTYKISLVVKKSKDIQGTVRLKNTLTGKLIMNRQLKSAAVSFSVNAALNKIVTFDCTDLLNEINPKIDFELGFELLYPESMPRKFTESETSIHACIATYPPREACIQDLIDAVGHQVDNLCFYLNRYQIPPPAIQAAVSDNEREASVHYILDSDGFPKASGKFKWLKKKGYVFTLDDDINYPNEYFEHLISWIEKLKRRAFVGVHGILFNESISIEDESVKGYIKEKFNFGDEVTGLKRVHMLGTGTLAFHSSLVEHCIDQLYDQMNHLEDCENSNDESLAVFAKKNEIPMFIVPRKKNWMTSNKKMRHGIHEEHFGDPDLAKNTRILLSEGNPWTSI
ncbi:glycosyltransferase [Thauera sp.]|uniref:glycosyltransferase family 2 protein n=1 Tax=Thauera sp. TaxID=1905334 RepID=UPI00260601C9|nr:glycosyltransferase [Thauera sp.]